MRNLKKALALVLALMMALSLMSFASASDYPDDNVIEQDEAVSVMSAVGVFNGTSGGVFDPAGTLTRAQAAKIITYMLLDKEVADSLPNTGSQFTDCPDGRWYVGSVNYLTDLGIVAGRSETTFDPNGNVTGYEFSKMLLGALGYDSKTEKFEGDGSWAINIAVAARRAGLGEGLATSAISSVPLTREQAAKLAFNTMTATMVYYQGGISVGEITVNPTRDWVANSASNDYDKTGAGDNYMQFCEQYFPALKLETYAAPDDFGRTPDGRWVNGKTAAYVNLADPTLVLTDKVSEADLTKQLPRGAALKNDSVTPKKNGANDTAITSMTGLAGATAPGKKVEIYVDSDNKIDKIIITEYKVETIDNITEKNGVTTYDFSVTANKTNSEDATNVIVSGTVAKGDVVTTALLNNGKVYVYPTTEFTGNQTAKRTSNTVTTVTIGGAQYVVGTGLANIANADGFGNSPDEAKYYADVNGYLVKKVDTKEAPAPEYAVIVAVVAGASSPTLDNPAGYTVNVRAVLADGTITDRTLATSQNSSSATQDVGDAYDLICGDVVLVDGAQVDIATGLQSNVNTALVGSNGKLFGYTLNDDGKMVLSAVTAATTGMTAEDICQVDVASYSGANNQTANGITTLFTKDTVFVLYNSVNGKWVVEEPKTGTANLSVSSVGGIAVMSATAAARGTASLVFLKASTVAQTTDEYVYIDASEYSTILKDGKSTDAWEGIAPDGTKVEVYGTHGAGHITKDGLYVYDTDKKLNETPKAATDTSDTTISSSDVYANITTGASVTDGLLHITGSTYVNITNDTQIVYLDPALEDGGVNGKNILVVMKASTSTPTEVATIYVYGTPDTRAAAATIGSISYDAGNTINVEGLNSPATPASGATVTITLADATVQKGDVQVTNSHTDVFTVTVGNVETAGNGTKTITLTIAAVATGASTTNSFDVKVAARNTTDYKDTATSTITVAVAAQTPA